MDHYPYKAFISYSHAADGRLAPALQSGLHRFAKPWYRLRAMKVFRDETSLATSPELWPSIESSLAEAEYFLYLASPEAAASYWVRKEIEFWLGHRPKGRMLIVLTDGELMWDRQAQDFDWDRTTVIPQGIPHRFEDEPFYLDLRWARTAEHLFLRNLHFRSAVADLASTLLGRPKDELIGEDVRRHRQTRRIAWSAVSTLVVLTIASIVAAVLAVRNQRLAEERGAIALSRQLATQAVSLAGSDRGDLALLLSLEALNVRATVDARNGLLSALTRDPYRLFHLHGHMGEITSLAFTPDGMQLLSLGCEGIGTIGLCKNYGVRRWDASSGEPCGEKILPDANRWTELVETTNGNALVARGNRSSWDLSTGQVIGDATTRGRISVDGKVVAKTHRSRLFLSDKDSGRRLQAPFGEPNESIRALAFHPNDPLVATGGSRGEVRLWDTNALLQGSTQPKRTIDVHRSAIRNLVFSPDGRYLITSSNDTGAFAWDLQTTEPAHRLSEDPDIAAATFSADGRWLALAHSIGERGGEIRLWDATRWRLSTTLAGRSPVAFHPDGRLLAATGADGTIVVRDLTGDRPLGHKLADARDPISVTFFDQGRRVVTGGRDGHLRIWDLDTRKLERPPIPTGQGWVQALAAHPDGRQLVSGGKDGSILLWDLESPGTDVEGKLVGRHDAPVGALTFSEDGGQIVSGGYDDALRFWSLDGTEVAESRPSIDTGQDVYAVAFDRPSARVATATEDGSVLLWDLTRSPATGVVVGTHLLQSDGMTGLAFGPDEGFLIASSLEQTQLWGIAPGEPRVRPPITGSFAALAPDGELLALIADNNEVQLVDVKAWRSFDAGLGQHRDPVSATAFSPDGRYFVAVADNDAVLWEVDIASWRKRACAIARRNLTTVEWQRYLGDLAYHRTCPDAPEPIDIPLDARRALGLAVRAYKLGDAAEMQRLFSQSASMAAAGDDPDLANDVCWFGAARDAAAAVMGACERAVELDSDNGGYRDSRGLARALTGDTHGALEDYRAYVVAVEHDEHASSRRARRQGWINALEDGTNPFDSMELHRVRSEGFFR